MKYLSSFFAAASIICLNSCVSTEIVEPETSSDRIILNLSAMDEVGTRASANHEGFKLRYTAILYRGSSANYIEESTRKREEIVEGENELNEIIFDVEPNHTYTIFVYADYIPASSTKTGKEYADHFYDTHTYKDNVVMLTTPHPNGDYSKVANDFFNNDNYDFFSSIVTIEKGEPKEERELTLKRSVAKVRVVDISDYDQTYDLSVPRFSHYANFSRTGENKSGAFNHTQHSSKISLEVGKSQQPDSNSEKELFFYYTFADEANNAATKTTLTFNLDGVQSYAKEFSVSDIPVRQNYITTIKGKFLPSSDELNPGDDTGGSDDDLIGPIYLYLSANDGDWENQTKNWSN